MPTTDYHPHHYYYRKSKLIVIELGAWTMSKERHKSKMNLTSTFRYIGVSWRFFFDNHETSTLVWIMICLYFNANKNLFWYFFVHSFRVSSLPLMKYQLPKMPVSCIKADKLLMLVNQIKPGVFIIALAAELFGFWDISFQLIR